MRLPQRERFTLIINELGAAVAGRSEDLQTALRRAVPALDETDNLLNLLANDSHTLQELTANSDAVVTALANNSKQVQNFIVEADNAATDTATQQANLKTTLQRFPGLLEQLKPAMAKLGAAADANTPVLQNLNAASGQLKTLFTNLAPCSLPAHRQPVRVRQRVAAGAAVARAGLGHRQAGGAGGGPDGRRCSTSSPEPRARAGPEPVDRAARPRQPRSRGRARPAQPGRQGLHRPRGAAPVRVQPGADDQHVRAVRAHAGRRRVRQPDVLAVRDARHDRGQPQAVRRRPTGSATRGSAPTSRASTSPTRRTQVAACPTRAERLRVDTGPQTSAAGLPGLGAQHDPAEPGRAAVEQGLRRG